MGVSEECSSHPDQRVGSESAECPLCSRSHLMIPPKSMHPPGFSFTVDDPSLAAIEIAENCQWVSTPSRSISRSERFASY